MENALWGSEYLKPMFFIVSNFSIAVHFRNRREKLDRLLPRHPSVAYALWPSLAVMWSVVVLTQIVFPGEATGLWAEGCEIGTMSVWLWAFVGIARTTRESTKVRGTAILAIGAHPEDIERGCGGTLSRYKELGYRVYALVMTSGEKSILHLSADDTRKEAEEGAEILGIDRVWVYHFKEAALATQIREMKDVIGEKIRQTRAEIVITHSSHDVHRDHAAVFEAARSAAGAEKTILCYEIDAPEREFSPNYFVDITGYLEEKVSAISAHRTQRDKSGSQTETVAGRASRRGQQVGVKHAEAFILYKGMDLWPS